MDWLEQVEASSTMMSEWGKRWEVTLNGIDAEGGNVRVNVRRSRGDGMIIVRQQLLKTW
jgi:hypothetical protein